MENLNEDIPCTSRKRRVKLRRRPRFNYIAGEVEHDENTPKIDCCKRSREFRVYNRDDLNLAPLGICCVNCDTEYLEKSEYESFGLLYDDHSEVEVVCIDEYSEADTDNELRTENILSVERKSVFHRKISKYNVGRYVAFMSMVQPTRVIIDCKDRSVIEQLQQGDHITWHRNYNLWHHQLIRENKGNGKCDVIHFYAPRKRCCATMKGEVRFDRDFDFTTQNGTAYQIVYKESVEDANPLKLVFDRANSRLLEKNYNLLWNNCEHLVTFCKTGRRTSVQSNWLFLKLLFLLIRFVIVSIVIGLIIFLQYENDERINRLEISVGITVIFLIEYILFVSIIVLWHVRLHRKLQICRVDRNRRIWETILEATITLFIYEAYLILLALVKDFLSASHCKYVIHVPAGIFSLIFGKVIGCLAGHAIAMCLPCNGRTGPTEPRQRRAVYGTETLL